MENRGLLFIPDISGFSRFINESEIRHSRLIIKELLEVLINANEIGLEISEIEGDAILFYKFGDPPGLEILYKQVEKMFCAFHQNLIAYEQHRYCQCQACIAAKDLTLKVISHYGEFTVYNIKNFNKLIGRDLVIAHKLLKNDVPQHEYWMITKNLTGDMKPEGLTQWMRWHSRIKRSEIGDIPFHYTQLSALKHKLMPDRSAILDLGKRLKVLSAERVYDTDTVTLCRATGDFQHRGRWQEGVKSVEILNHWLPRVGMKCRYVFEDEAYYVYSTSYQYEDGYIQYSEMDEHGDWLTLFTLEQITPERTKFTMDFYLKRNLVSQSIFRLFRKRKMRQRFEKSMNKLVGLINELKQPRSVRA